MNSSLANKTIAIPETRQLDVFANLLERRGANVMRCPLVGIHTTPDIDSVLAWVQRFNAGEMDDLVLLTGEGLRRILGILDHDLELSDAFIAQLGKVRKLTRGPKPAKALRDIGLTTDLTAAQPTTDGVITTLSEFDLTGRRVGVQLYGSYENPPLIEFLTRAGATADPVAPYVYADEAEDLHVEMLIDELVSGEVDVIAFTASPQVRRLLQIAKNRGKEKALREGLKQTLVAAVGPMVRDELLSRDLRCDLMPEDSYFMKPLVRALEERFA